VRYLDSSAIVKLVAPEPETSALVESLRADPEVVSSVLSRVEVLRAVRRTGASGDREERANAVIDRIALISMEDAILIRAARLEPTSLRTLDAIHLATALSLGADVAGLITYDAKLAEAAASEGLDVLAPS
jgi:predicted nucleic acid-binding protein